MTSPKTRTLEEIALSYKTDKSGMHHFYTKLYAMYFEPIRQSKLKIFEIGIDNGFSLKTWKEYFPHAEITGLDIVNLKHMEEDRVHVVCGDQSDPKILKETSEKYGPFDIIIDDGSHLNKDMNASFEILFPLLKEGGLYIVEDLHACYWKNPQNTGEPVFINTLKKLVDDVNSSGKSGVADIRKDGHDGVYNLDSTEEMTWWEKNVEFMHLYRSSVFRKKYPPAKAPHSGEKNPTYLTVSPVIPVVQIDYLGKKLKQTAKNKIKHILHTLKK